MYIWQDKKRLFGLTKILWIFPSSFTDYFLNEKALIVKKGILNKNEEQVLLYRIVDISINQTFLDRLFKVGTLTIISDDENIPELKVQKILNPGELRDKLNNAIEISRSRNLVISRETLDENRENYLEPEN